MPSPPSPPPPPPPRRPCPTKLHEEHGSQQQCRPPLHHHPLHPLAAFFTPDPFSGRENFPPFENIFENSIVASEVSFSSSLNMSIGARAALDEHARMIARFGLDGCSREQDHFCHSRTTTTTANTTGSGTTVATREMSEPDNPLDRLWNKLLEDRTEDARRERHFRGTVADHVVAESAEEDFEASYMNDFARVTTTALERTIDPDDDDDDYFDSSRILLLASPEKGTSVPQLQGRSPTCRRDYSCSLEESFTSNASSAFSPDKLAEISSSEQCLFQPPNSPPTQRKWQISPPPSDGKQVIDSSFVSLAAIDLSRISLHDEVDAALAMARKSPDSSFFSLEVDNRGTIDVDNGGEMYFRTGGTILFPETSSSSSNSDSPRPRRRQVSNERELVRTPPSRKQQRHQQQQQQVNLNLSSLGLSPIASGRITRATTCSSPNCSFASSTLPASPRKENDRPIHDIPGRSVRATPGKTTIASRQNGNGTVARTPPHPRRQLRHDHNLRRSEKAPPHDTPPHLRKKIHEFQMTDLADLSPIAGRAAAAAAAATTNFNMVHSSSHSSLLSLGSSSPMQPLQHGRAAPVLTKWPTAHNDVENDEAVVSPAVVTVEDRDCSRGGDPAMSCRQVDCTGLDSAERKNPVCAQDSQAHLRRNSQLNNRRPPPFSMNDRRRYRTVVPTRVFYDADEFECQDSFSLSRRDYM